MPVFELVWPLCMDDDFMQRLATSLSYQAQRLCRPPKRRALEAAGSTNELSDEVQNKLRRLSVHP